MKLRSYQNTQFSNGCSDNSSLIVSPYCSIQSLLKVLSAFHVVIRRLRNPYKTLHIDQYQPTWRAWSYAITLIAMIGQVIAGSFRAVLFFWACAMIHARRLGSIMHTAV